MAEIEEFDPGHEAPEERAFDYARTVALSDGIFAIALTLLVLTISFPELSPAEEHEIGQRLLDRGQEYSSYAVSFALIAFFWVRHHVFFRGLARIDGRLTFLNLLYLALVAFVPYPTRILGQYGSQAAAVVAYAASIASVSLAAGGMRAHAIRAGLLSAAGRRRLAGREHWLVAPVVLTMSIPIAFLSPSVAKLCWVLMLVTPALQRFRRRRRVG